MDDAGHHISVPAWLGQKERKQCLQWPSCSFTVSSFAFLRPHNPQQHQTQWLHAHEGGGLWSLTPLEIFPSIACMRVQIPLDSFAPGMRWITPPPSRLAWTARLISHSQLGSNVTEADNTVALWETKVLGETLGYQSQWPTAWVFNAWCYRAEQNVTEVWGGCEEKERQHAERPLNYLDQPSGSKSHTCQTAAFRVHLCCCGGRKRTQTSLTWLLVLSTWTMIRWAKCRVKENPDTIFACRLYGCGYKRYLRFSVLLIASSSVFSPTRPHV